MAQETILYIALLVLFLPLASFTVLIFLNKRMPRQGDWFGTAVLFFSLILSIVMLFSKLGSYHDEIIQGSFTWIDFGDVPGWGPLTVTLVSDNVTNVSIYKVGKLGSFETHELDLRPGTYVAVGSRPGYRDVRLEFRVAPEIDTQPVVVRCEEPI